MKKLLVVFILVLALAVPAYALTDPEPLCYSLGLFHFDSEHDDLGVNPTLYTYLALVSNADGDAGGIYWFDGEVTHLALNPDVNADPSTMVDAFAQICMECPDYGLYFTLTPTSARAYSPKSVNIFEFSTRYPSRELTEYDTLDDFIFAVLDN